MVRIKVLDDRDQSRGGMPWLPQQWNTVDPVWGATLEPGTGSALHFYTGSTLEVAKMKARLFKDNHALVGRRRVWLCESSGQEVIQSDKAGSKHARITEFIDYLPDYDEYFLRATFAWWLLRALFKRYPMSGLNGPDVSVEAVTSSAYNKRGRFANVPKCITAGKELYSVWHEHGLDRNAPMDEFYPGPEPWKSFSTMIGAGAYLMNMKNNHGVQVAESFLRNTLPTLTAIPMHLFDHLSHSQLDGQISSFIQYYSKQCQEV